MKSAQKALSTLGVIATNIVSFYGREVATTLKSAKQDLGTRFGSALKV
jgi:hypothetical protein